MNEFDVVFSVIVALTFVLQVVNYYLFHLEGDEPMSDGHRLLFLTVLGGFCITEALVAYDGRPIYLLYVLLNLWGIRCLWKRRA